MSFVKKDRRYLTTYKTITFIFYFQMSQFLITHSLSYKSSDFCNQNVIHVDCCNFTYVSYRHT